MEQVSEEAESFRASLDKYTSRHQKRVQEAQERAELLGRAVLPPSQINNHLSFICLFELWQLILLNVPFVQSGDAHVLRIFDEEAQAVESVRRSSRLLEESFATGVAILSKYSEQRDHLKVTISNPLLDAKVCIFLKNSVVLLLNVVTTIKHSIWLKN